jgi:hypothetical protein
MGGGGDIEEDHFVGPLLIVADREFDRIADIAQAAFLGATELDAAGDLSGMDIETWDDASG